MTFHAFIARNLRWLFAGLALTFFSSFGQTFFIGFFSAELRDSLSLSHGGFGMIYMIATLASAISLVFIGKLADVWSVRKISAITLLALSCACLLMANANTVLVLMLAIYMLRLAGQGMMSHIAVTAMGRWYSRERGRAIAVCTLGHQLGDGLLPMVLVLLGSWIGWQKQWYVFAAVLVLIAWPLLMLLLQQDRTPSAVQKTDQPEIESWSMTAVRGDWAFWVMCLTVLAPSYIGTSVFFQQVHLRELKDWSPTLVATAFTCLAVTHMVVGMLAGAWVDRFSATRALPFFLLPLAAACLVLSQFSVPLTLYVFMVLLGFSYGLSNIVFGAIWAETYGTKHLGAIRAIATASMVLGSALSPGISGWLIDQGMAIDKQLEYMGSYCLVLFLVLIFVSRSLNRRQSVFLLSR